MRTRGTAVRASLASHPGASSGTPELRNETAIADSLLHPQDRAYSVPQLFELIENAELTFGRWLRQAPYSVRCGAIATIPQAGKIARLPLEEQYAAIELFRGSMIRHTAVVYRNDYANAPLPFNAADDEWQKYVPIRMADTVRINDRVPAGAAAVLINRTHTYTYKDLFLTIGHSQKRLVDAIDGQRTIGAILAKTRFSDDLSVDLDLARHFFEQLWWHDQVVFDTTLS